MNAATFLVRSTALVGVGSTLCWTIGFAWDTVREPPLLGLTVVAALPTSAVVVLANRQRPGILAVPDETEFPRLLLRLSVAGFVSYAALWAIIIAVGMTLLWMFPPDAGSEARVGVAILAWWAPMWISPVPAAFLATLWSRKDGIPAPGSEG